MLLDLSNAENQIKCVSTFNDLVSEPFFGNVNAFCFQRELIGDFFEIVKKIDCNENLVAITEHELCELNLSKFGNKARQILLEDMQLLKNIGAQPTLNLIKQYERDEAYLLFPTDVYSFHVDRSPIPTHTFLCTYYGESSQILPNSKVQQKVLIPEIRKELQKLYGGADDEGFEAFLKEYFFDLHYQPAQNAVPISLGIGNLWRLAVDHPEMEVPPCVHCAPLEKEGETRLMIIC